MDKVNQKDIFFSFEGDNWFGRNSSYIDEKYDVDQDKIIEKIKDYNLKPLNVLEIGSSYGYRLNEINKIWKSDCFGIEPSMKAVDHGTFRFSNIKLIRGTADNLTEYNDNKFDLIIINFVFHWIDRALLLRCIGEIDRVLQDKGILIIGDFYPNYPIKNKYHHLQNENVFTYKQNYENVFLSSELYTLIDKSSINHEKHILDASEDYYNRCYLSLLKKDITSRYVS